MKKGLGSSSNPRYDTAGRLRGAEEISMAIMERTSSGIDKIVEILGKDADNLLSFACKGIPKEQITVPGPDHVERVWSLSDRKPPVLVNLQRLYGTGRLANTGYLSILPVDQGVEHSAAASFAPNPAYFDPENIVRLAIEAGCNAVASTVGVLGILSRKYAHKIPFIAKINHNELLTYPNKFQQILFGSVEEAWNMGAAAVGATVYFGSDDADREIVEIAEAFQQAHELGLATVLWAYTRNNAFKKDGWTTTPRPTSRARRTTWRSPCRRTSSSRSRRR